MQVWRGATVAYRRTRRSRKSGATRCVVVRLEMPCVCGSPLIFRHTNPLLALQVRLWPVWKPLHGPIQAHQPRACHFQVRLWPAWHCCLAPCRPSYPGTPTTNPTFTSLRCAFGPPGTAHIQAHQSQRRPSPLAPRAQVLGSDRCAFLARLEVVAPATSYTSHIKAPHRHRARTGFDGPTSPPAGMLPPCAPTSRHLRSATPAVISPSSHTFFPPPGPSFAASMA